MTDKPLIFISHISDEAKIARAFKECIEISFLGMVDIFVSSDRDIISLGSNWLDRITTALRRAEAMFIFCSPASITRPWINFESGAGWSRGIEIVPLCHSGLRPINLPLPLNLLQGIEANDETKLSDVFKLVADKIGCKLPKTDLSQLASAVREFERTYIIEVKAAPALHEISQLWPELAAGFKMTPDGNIVAAGVPEWKINLVRLALIQLRQQGLLDFSYGRKQTRIGGPDPGDFGELAIQLTPELVAISSKCA